MTDVPGRRFSAPTSRREPRRFEGLSPVPVVLLAAVTAAASVSLLIVAGRQGIAADDLLRDPAIIAGFPPHLGLFSNLGLGLLWATAGAAFIGAARRGPERPSLLAVAGLSALMAADDQFMLHDYYLPLVLPYGEGILLIFYAGCGFAIAAFNRHRLFRAAHLGLLLSLACLGMSVILDQIGGGPEVEDVAEDLLKFVGLVLWTAYRCAMARDEVRREPR